MIFIVGCVYRNGEKNNRSEQVEQVAGTEQEEEEETVAVPVEHDEHRLVGVSSKYSVACLPNNQIEITSEE